MGRDSFCLPESIGPTRNAARIQSGVVGCVSSSERKSRVLCAQLRDRRQWQVGVEVPQRQAHMPIVRHLVGNNRLHFHVAHQRERADTSSQRALEPEEAAQRMSLREREDRAGVEQRSTWKAQTSARAHALYGREELGEATIPQSDHLQREQRHVKNKAEPGLVEDGPDDQRDGPDGDAQHEQIDQRTHGQ